MVGVLTALNLRGVKESVIVLMPIFLAFMLSHIGLITSTASSPRREPGRGGDRHAAGHARRRRRISAGSACSCIFLRAFSLGGGTFTGIEAVSNSTDILREPRVETGKRTMLYMATSLAFTAGGILLLLPAESACSHEPGKTLNATLWDVLAARLAASAGCNVGTGDRRGSRCSPRARCCSSRRRPASSPGRARWRRWRWTSGCRSASRTSPSGSSRRTASSPWASPPALVLLYTARLGRAAAWSCTRSTCS